MRRCMRFSSIMKRRASEPARPTSTPRFPLEKPDDDDCFDDVPFFARDWEHPLETLHKEVRDAKNRPDGEVERLGTKQIDGRTAVGFRFELKEKKDTTKTIWADQETGLPIKIEEIQNGFHIGYKDSRFNVELDDSLFDLEPPEGYTVEVKRKNQDTDETRVR